jgi:hypothetical protein
MGLNLFCGMIWSPFTHLAANIIEKRYNLPEKGAASSAAYLLAGPFVLYPLCGFLVDRRKHHPIVIQLLLLSSALTMFAYTWLALSPKWTKTPIPAIIAFAIGHGFSPLLLVVLVTKIVPLKYISTALGAHKSMEQTGSTLFQTFAGILLDSKKPGESASATTFQYLLNALVAFNLLECGTILLLAYFQYRKNMVIRQSRSRHNSFAVEIPNQETPLLSSGDHARHRSSGSNVSTTRPLLIPETHKSQSELRRGRFMAMVCATIVLFAWILFMTTAWFKLGGRGNH